MEQQLKALQVTTTTDSIKNGFVQYRLARKHGVGAIPDLFSSFPFVSAFV